VSNFGFSAENMHCKEVFPKVEKLPTH